jgi:hypothetical protein
MLAAVPKHTKKIDVGLPCFDHLLNLVVRAANLANPDIQEAIKDCKSFSARVHHSSPDHQRIRRECYLLKNDSNPIECEFRKVITDVDTRWNSTYFLLKSIHLLRPALDSIREERYEDEKTNPDFKAKIPSPLTFEIIAQILPIMEKAELVSRIMSADQKPTICEVITVKIEFFVKYSFFSYFSEFYIIFSVLFVKLQILHGFFRIFQMLPVLTNMSIFLHNLMEQDQDSWAKEYATVFMAEMVKRFPPAQDPKKDPTKAIILGSGVAMYVHALFIHPYFRGNLIKKINDKEYKMR